MEQKKRFKLTKQNFVTIIIFNDSGTKVTSANKINTEMNNEI